MRLQEDLRVKSSTSLDHDVKQTFEIQMSVYLCGQYLAQRLIHCMISKLTQTLDSGFKPLTGTKDERTTKVGV